MTARDDFTIFENLLERGYSEELDIMVNLTNALELRELEQLRDIEILEEDYCYLCGYTRMEAEKAAGNVILQ